MKKCCVIISSYNGEKFISHQLNSILAQQDVEVDIYIRDDGSTDRTLDIINDFINKYNNIYLIKGKNVGVVESFRLCAEYVCQNVAPYEYYAFSDQDDEWLSNKLYSAIIKIDSDVINKRIPFLYYSNLKVSDSNLNYLYERFSESYVLNTKKQIMSEICTLGCTCVFNYALLSEFVRTNLNHRIPHDAWVTVLAAFLGQVVYDKNSYILYRQHGDNQSGSVKKGLPMYLSKIKKIKHIFDMDGDYEAIAREMLDNYKDELKSDDRKMLEIISGYRNNLKFRLILLFTNYVSSSHTWKEIARRIRILCNRL